MTAPFKPPAKPIEPLDSWAVNKFKARLGEIIGCGGCLSVFVVLIGLILLGLSVPTAAPVTAEDRALVFDVHRVSDWSDDPIDPAWESMFKEASGGESELGYSYDPANEGPYIASLLWLGDDRGASVEKHAEYRTYLSDPDLAYQPIPGRCIWGQTSECGLVSYDGELAGNFFVGRKGKAVVFIQILRVYSDDAGDIEAIFLPYLETLEDRTN